MANVEIVFLGLCTFLNLENTRPDMPPASVIVHRDPHHNAYIGFRHKDVTMSGGSAVTSGDYSILPLDGVQLLLNDDWSKSPDLTGKDLDKVAQALKIADIPLGNWNTNRVPLPGKLPDPSEVSGYLEFGGGKLSGGRVSKIDWEFRDRTGKPSDKQAKDKNYKFAESVVYAFPVDGDSLVIKTISLNGSGMRKLTFKSIGGAPLKIFIGNSMDPAEDMEGTAQPPAGASEHFATFYEVVTGSPNVHIPHALGKRPLGAGTGYCGPDKEP